ncbi:MAG TPA: hypothetical protein VMT02_06080 [Burkholderiales bacterium]|jgi:hypothetical protein|nr:hypothetical protein [Burkholderiales bacterium]
MTRPLRYLLLVVALLFAQHAAMLHGLAHAKHDLALAAHHDGKTPELGHGSKDCAAFGALAHAVGGVAVTRLPATPQVAPQSRRFASFFAVTRTGFASRAPPLAS